MSISTHPLTRNAVNTQRKEEKGQIDINDLLQTLASKLSEVIFSEYFPLAKLGMRTEQLKGWIYL